MALFPAGSALSIRPVALPFIKDRHVHRHRRRASAQSPSPRPAKEDRHFVTALARGLQVLACFRSGDSQLGNQELAERCGLPKSTVSRLTMTLTRLGYLIQTPDTGRYRLGMATLSLGSAMLSRLDLRQVARPLMQELAAFSGASVSLGARDRLVDDLHRALSRTRGVDAVDGRGRAHPAGHLGDRPRLPRGDRRAQRAEIMDEVRANDPAAWPKVRAGIERAVKDHAKLGVTCSFGDWQKDVNGIARAFQPGGGLPPMAISCGGPASSLSRDFLLDQVRPRLIELTQRLEATLPR